MHVAFLSLQDFRSYPSVELTLQPGVTTFVGPNGKGKTNLLEAVAYVATLGSHRVATDAPLIRAGAACSIVRAAIDRDGRTTLAEIEINPGRSNRARINRSPVSRPRELLGALRVVLFSPDDLALVKGDPGERRRFLDDTLVARTPRLASVRADYERVLKQRNALLKSAAGAGRGQRRRGGARSSAPVTQERGEGDEQAHTLDVWDSHLARAGAELTAARLELLAELRPLVQRSYEALAREDSRVTMEYASSAYGREERTARSDSADSSLEAHQDGSVKPDEPVPDRSELRRALLDRLSANRSAELERGISLVGPHRDELAVGLGELPARGYASHGESWSLALALRLAAYELLREDGGDPVLLLDDVFAELDPYRRERLASLVGSAEQVLVTAAYAGDIPPALAGRRVEVTAGAIRDLG